MQKIAVSATAAIRRRTSARTRLPRQHRRANAEVDRRERDGRPEASGMCQRRREPRDRDQHEHQAGDLCDHGRDPAVHRVS